MAETTWPPAWELKPAHGEPQNDTAIHLGPGIGWDLAFGCRLNFGVDEDGPTVSIHFSDADLARGFVKREVSADQLRRFAGLLGWLAEEVDRRG